MHRTWIAVLRNPLLAATALVLASAGAGAEEIKIGMVRSASHCAEFVAQEKGYFAGEGLAASFAYFESAQPVAVAVTAGDIDFGSGGTSGGFYNLATQGALKIISGGVREAPGFRAFAYLVANSAYAAGLKSFGDLPHHSVGISQVGGPPHYILARLAEKYALDLGSIRTVPLQSWSNSFPPSTAGRWIW